MMPREREPIKRREEDGPPTERKKPPSKRDPMDDLQDFYQDNEQDLDTQEPSKE